MRTFALAPALLAGILISAHASPARAQLNHTWVASNGSDANNCDRLTPCATFAGALAKTTARGEITCVDTGLYTGLTINKAITINCEGHGGVNIVGAGNVAEIIVTIAASDVVTLRGLDMDGRGVSPTGNGGAIWFTSAGVLHVDQVKINNLPASVSGIAFTPTGPAKLFVADSTITDIGNSGTPAPAGITIRPASGVFAEVTIERTRIANNFHGIIADGTSGGTIRGVVRDSTVSGNLNDGITTMTNSPAASVVLAIDNTTVYGNTVGLKATGGTTTGMLVSRSFITMNSSIGLSTSGGSALYSYRDNRVNGNTSDGVFTGFINTQ
jgi:hypothetical protein